MALVNNYSEERSGKEVMFLQVVSADSEQGLVGRTERCTVVEAWASGLRVRSEKRIQSLCLVDLWVDIDGHPGKFFLTGLARWSKEADADGLYSIEIDLKNNPASDITDWRVWFSWKEQQHAPTQYQAV